MEGDDSEQLVIADNPPPSDQTRKLKRLKKTFNAPKKSPVFKSLDSSSKLLDSANSGDEVVGSDKELFDSVVQDDEAKSPVDSTNSGYEMLGPEKDLFDSVLQDNSPGSSAKSVDSTKSCDVVVESEGRSTVFEREKESEEFDLLFPWEGEKSGAKRVLDFGPDEDDSSDEGDLKRDSENRGSEAVVEDNKKENRKRAKRNGGEEEKKERKRKKKDDKSGGADTKPRSSKRKEKEERKAEIDMLVDYQRKLRERRDVAFKPVAAVQKPVSSVLERIRQRKQEVALKAAISLSNQFSDSVGEIMIESDSEEVVIVKKEDRKEELLCKEGIDPTAVKVDRPSSSPVGKSDEDLTKMDDGDDSCEMPPVEDKEPSAAFRPPTNDTQELYSESQTSDTQDGVSNAGTGSSQDDDVAPSLPSMNLKLDSVPLDDDIDISSEEEDEEEEENDKENINPIVGQLFKGNLSPKGDPVKEFLDEEALEEDCSDDDKRRFEDEGEDYSDAEEMAEMIATNYDEKPVDHERRNELHQMWLAQQDEDGTENLLHKYKIKQKDVTLLDEEDEGHDSHEMDDESGDEDLPPTNGARLKTKQLRQLIPLMFTDKDDGYISSDDEETERSLNKQRLLGKVVIKEQAAFASPAENEMSREVFGRIKKLNLVAETKKKAKTSSIFQNLVKKGSDSSNSSKSSFLNRMSSIPVSSRRVSNTVKAFIFGRDDSNSKSSISASEEDSRDAMNQAEKTIQRKRTFTAKFSSQARQTTQTSAGTSHSTSLIDILKRSSVQTSHFAQDNNSTVDHQAAFDAFKPSKRPVKIEARS